MAIELDEIDVRLLTALQADADCTNVELARLVGLSPAGLAPPPRPPATRPTPARDSAKPAQATGRATARCHTAAMTATITGTVPISRAACVTLVRVMPAFCTTTDPP